MIVLVYASTVVLYFLYNRHFFAFTSHALNLSVPRWRTDAAAFALNYLLFIALSIFEFPLVANWTVIGVVYVLEVKLILHATWHEGVLVALLGASVGLASNMVMRSACAIALDVPLAMVNVATASLKALPVALGFLLAAVSMRIIDVPSNHRVLGTIFLEHRVLGFLLAALPLCYLYLRSNFMLYYSDMNILAIKLWGIKSALFVSVSVSLAIWFAYKLASTLTQARRREALRREIEEAERESANLRDEAEHDLLTGCHNRIFAERRLAELLAAGAPCQVVFVDVDNLKQVNDRFGHEAGDSYIASVAGALGQARASAHDVVARFGGDEFLVVLTEPATATDLSERMFSVGRELRDSVADEGLSFVPTASWGSAIAEPGDTPASVIARADAVMYKNKRRKGALRDLAG